MRKQSEIFELAPHAFERSPSAVARKQTSLFIGPAESVVLLEAVMIIEIVLALAHGCPETLLVGDCDVHATAG